MKKVIILEKEDIKTTTIGNRIGIATKEGTMILFEPEAFIELKKDVNKLCYNDDLSVVLPSYVKDYFGL